MEKGTPVVAPVPSTSHVAAALKSMDQLTEKEIDEHKSSLWSNNYTSLGLAYEFTLSRLFQLAPVIEIKWYSFYKADHHQEH